MANRRSRDVGGDSDYNPPLSPRARRVPLRFNDGIPETEAREYDSEESYIPSQPPSVGRPQSQNYNDNTAVPQFLPNCNLPADPHAPSHQWDSHQVVAFSPQVAGLTDYNSQTFEPSYVRPPPNQLSLLPLNGKHFALYSTCSADLKDRLYRSSTRHVRHHIQERQYQRTSPVKWGLSFASPRIVKLSKYITFHLPPCSRAFAIAVTHVIAIVFPIPAAPSISARHSNTTCPQPRYEQHVSSTNTSVQWSSTSTK